MHLRAAFSTDGLPCELWWNGAFQELVVWRSRTTNDNYLMDDANRTHILIQAQHTWNVWNRDFDSRDWTVQSPAIDGYEEQNDISAKAPDVQAACERLFKWFQACRADETQLRKEMHQYLHMQSWLDYLIMINVTGSFDSMQNNLFLGTWDAERWSIWLFDHDRTFGVTAWQDRAAAAPDKIGWITVRGGTADQDPGIFDVIQRNLRPELRARWAELRLAGVVSAENLTRIIRRQIALIDGASMTDDLENWGRGGENTVRLDLAYDGRWSISYIQEWFRGRVAWMDAQWGLMLLSNLGVLWQSYGSFVSDFIAGVAGWYGKAAAARVSARRDRLEAGAQALRLNEDLMRRNKVVADENDQPRRRQAANGLRSRPLCRGDAARLVVFDRDASARKRPTRFQSLPPYPFPLEVGRGRGVAESLRRRQLECYQ